MHMLYSFPKAIDYTYENKKMVNIYKSTTLLSYHEKQ